MKTLILFATKHGAAEEIAQRISTELGGAVVHNLADESIPDLTGFDSVIIGSSIYAGSIRKEAKNFLTQNTALLQSKKLGLFISGMSTSEEMTPFKNNFPAELLEAAKATGFLGGIYNPQKSGFFERLIMKAITKQSAYISTVSDEKIKKFAENFK